MIWILSGFILGGAIQLLIEAASCKTPYGVDWRRAETRPDAQGARYIGFQFSLRGVTAEEYQKGLSQAYGDRRPRAGEIIEWVVDSVEEDDTGFTATGHFRSRPDPLMVSL